MPQQRSPSFSPYIQSNKHTRFYTLTNASNHNSRPRDNKVSEWLLQCTCMARLQPYILYILGAPNDNHPH